jgi:2'-5' RNA ligase
LAGDLVGLHDLSEVVRAELTAVGLATDPREFRPHLTISRPGATISADLVAADAARLGAYTGPLWITDTVELVAVNAIRGDAARGAGPRSSYTRLTALPL